jgi:Fe-S-cluster containining protein
MQEMHLRAHSNSLEKHVFDKLPLTTCLGCPIKGGEGHEVVAECCRKASPPLYFIEFIHAYQYMLQNWSKDRIKDVIFRCYEALLNSSHTKPCVLLNLENNSCSIYTHRWTNCRTYGMVPDNQWIDRAKIWVKEVTADRFLNFR